MPIEFPGNVTNFLVAKKDNIYLLRLIRSKKLFLERYYRGINFYLSDLLVFKEKIITSSSYLYHSIP